MNEEAIDGAWRQHRSLLVDIAFKMLGNFRSAEDVVQEAFSRLVGVDLDNLDDVRAWLVVLSAACAWTSFARSAGDARISVPTPVVLRPPELPTPLIGSPSTTRSSWRSGVRQRLSPAERTVFVLHDVFRFSFETAASIVGRSPEACRQLASRARRRVDAETSPARFELQPADPARVTQRFMAAGAGGDMEALMQILDPDVVGEVELDAGGTRRRLVGRDRVMRNLLRLFGGSSGVTMVSHSVRGRPGALAFRDRELAAVLDFEMTGEMIDEIHAIGDPARLAIIDLQLQARPTAD